MSITEDFVVEVAVTWKGWVPAAVPGAGVSENPTLSLSVGKEQCGFKEHAGQNLAAKREISKHLLIIRATDEQIISDVGILTVDPQVR